MLRRSHCRRCMPPPTFKLYRRSCNVTWGYRLWQATFLARKNNIFISLNFTYRFGDTEEKTFLARKRIDTENCRKHFWGTNIIAKSVGRISPKTVFPANLHLTPKSVFPSTFLAAITQICSTFLARNYRFGRA